MGDVNGVWRKDNGFTCIAAFWLMEHELTFDRLNSILLVFKNCLIMLCFRYISRALEVPDGEDAHFLISPLNVELYAKNSSTRVYYYCY